MQSRRTQTKIRQAAPVTADSRQKGEGFPFGNVWHFAASRLVKNYFAISLALENQTGKQSSKFQ